MDRFFMRLSLGYPAEDRGEDAPAARRHRARAGVASGRARRRQVLALQDATEKVAVADRLLDYLQADRAGHAPDGGASAAGLHARRAGPLPRGAGARARAAAATTPPRTTSRRSPSRCSRTGSFPSPPTASAPAAGSGEGDQAQDPGAGAGAGVTLTRLIPDWEHPRHQLRPGLHPDVPRRRDRGDEHGQQRPLPGARGVARGADRLGVSVAPQRARASRCELETVGEVIATPARLLKLKLVERAPRRARPRPSSSSTSPCRARSGSTR